MRKMTWWGCAALVAGAMGCDDGADPDAALDLGVDASVEVDEGGADRGATDSGATDGGVTDGGVSCAPGTAYVGGTPLFVERTDAWGLAEMGVAGALVTVADIDDDGWPDLVVRRYGERPDPLGDDAATRQTWVLRNNGEGGFEDFTVASGLLATRGVYPAQIGRPVGVVVFGDVDGDGDLDVYTGADSRTQRTVTIDEVVVPVEETSELLLNDGSGHFELTFARDPIRRAGIEDIPISAAFTDVDLDGDLDLWLAQGGVGAPRQDRLYLNIEGDFRDDTVGRGLQTEAWRSLEDLNAGRGHSQAWGVAACDLNGDGLPELLTASYGRAPNHLWQASLDGEVLRYSHQGVASGFAFDEDQDWTGDEFARCYCELNRDAEGCADVPVAAVQCTPETAANWQHDSGREPFRLGGNSGTVLCNDFDGDGHIDLFTSEIKHWWAGAGADGAELLLNTGEADVRFTRPGREATGVEITHPGRSWDEGMIGAGLIDVDNDGRMDVYLGGTDYPGNYGVLLLNQSEPGAPRFLTLPVEDYFEHNRSHGVGVADFDRDGDLDMVVGHSRMRCDAAAPNDCYPTQQLRFFENVYGQDGHWMQLDLRGRGGANALAMGARVTVQAGDRQMVQEVSGGYGIGGAQADRVLHFGLGDACEAQVTVRWPDAEGTTEVFQLEAGARHRLVMGEGG